VRDRRRLAPVRHAELPEDVGDVDARRLDADHECLRDLPILVAAGDQREDLCLARREPEGVGEAFLAVRLRVRRREIESRTLGEIDCDDVLRGLGVPLLVTQGRADTVMLPATAEHLLATYPTAEASWYEDVGHAPHLENPERFNRELAALTRRVRARV
jgi:pimeloyl-ACP methyl ester carboxylesterase